MIAEKNIIQSIIGGVDFYLLRAVTVVARALTISAAAERLNAAQHRLSSQMKRLETRAGRSLFGPVWQGRSRRSRAEEERLVLYAEQIVSARDEAICNLSPPLLFSKLLTGVPNRLVVSNIKVILVQFKQMHAELQWELSPYRESGCRI